MKKHRPSLCDTCASLKLERKDFVTSPFEPAERYGKVIHTYSVENLRKKQSKCALCHLFWQAINKRTIAAVTDARSVDLGSLMVAT